MPEIWHGDCRRANMREPENSWEVAYIIAFITGIDVGSSLEYISNKIAWRRRKEILQWFDNEAPIGWIREHISL